MPMRARTVSPDFFLHRRLYEAERDTGFPIRIFFEGLWCASDREGRFEWKEDLKAAIIPYDEATAAECLDALVKRKFVESYWHQGRRYGLVPSMKRYQPFNGREAPSRLPDPFLADGVRSRESVVDQETLSLPLGDAPAAPVANPRKRTAAKKAADKPATPPSWSYRACQMYELKFGHVANGGKIGRFLKPLITRFGEEPTLDAWGRYLEHKDPQFIQPADFASHFSIWTPEGFAQQNRRSSAPPRKGTPKKYEYNPSEQLPPEQD